MKYRQRVLGLILVSPLCKEPSWSEWLYNKVPFLCRNILSRKKSCYFLLKNLWFCRSCQIYCTFMACVGW